jgi:hypothetical protein
MVNSGDIVGIWRLDQHVFQHSEHSGHQGELARSQLGSERLEMFRSAPGSSDFQVGLDQMLAVLIDVAATIPPSLRSALPMFKVVSTGWAGPGTNLVRALWPFVTRDPGESMGELHPKDEFGSLAAAVADRCVRRNLQFADFDEGDRRYRDRLRHLQSRPPL